MSNVRDFGAVGDGRADDSPAIEHALRDGDGTLEFPRGEYLISRTIQVALSRVSRTSIHGSGGTAKILMVGPGPAIALKGSHSTTADPTGFRQEEWVHERMPTVDGIEIEGRHPEADGILIDGVMQPTLTRVLIRLTRHGIHVTNRARNLLISHCHVYHNRGIGIYLNQVNLHQAIITGSHVSYCRLGGIRIEQSEVRNLQITGNDIEYNNNRVFENRAEDELPTAEIYVDVGSKGSVREGTISGNTIQATFSPAGANIRLIGDHARGDHLFGMWTITGNLIGSQRINLHLTAVRGVTIVGNYLYSAYHRNLLAEHCQNLVIGSNCFGHNPDYKELELATGIRLEDCSACSISGTIVEDARAGKHTVHEAPVLQRDGLVELIRCRYLNVNGAMIFDGVPVGLFLDDCSETVISGCTFADRRAERLMEKPIRWQGSGQGNVIQGCRLGLGTQGGIAVPDHVKVLANTEDEGGERSNGK